MFNKYEEESVTPMCCRKRPGKVLREYLEQGPLGNVEVTRAVLQRLQALTSVAGSDVLSYLSLKSRPPEPVGD